MRPRNPQNLLKAQNRIDHPLRRLIMFHQLRVVQCVALLAGVLALAQSADLSAQTATLSDSDKKLLAEFTSKVKEYSNTEHSLTADKMKPTTDVAKLELQRH